MKLNVGKPVTGNELIGRKEEVDIVLKTLMAGQSVALIAPRRFGKTSMLLEVQRKLKQKGYYTGVVDIFTTPTVFQLAKEITGQVLSNKRLDKAFRRIVKNLSEVLGNIRLKNEILDADFILSFAKQERDEWELIKNSIGYIDRFAARNRKNICFGFDEFGDIKKLNGNEIVKLFRGMIQKQKNSVFIFSGSYESVMDQLFVTNKSPFYRMVRIVEPRFLDINESIRYVKRRFKQLKIDYNEELITRGVHFTEGHPYYLRLFMQEYSFASEDDGQMATLGTVIAGMMNTEKNYIEKVWDELSTSKELKYGILKIVESNGKPYAGAGNPRYNLSRAMSELKGMGYIFKKQDRYILTDPLLGYYIKTMILKIT